MSETTLDAATRTALIETMVNRANVYSLLSRCWQSEVDTALADELSTTFVFESDNETLNGAVAAIKETLQGIDEAALEQLAVTFDRVFFGMGPLTARHAFPYESVYTSDRGIMMQEAFGQVVSVYRQERLAKDESFKEPEDHLAVELAFMATLAQRAQTFLKADTAEGDDAATAAVEQSQRFLADHLFSWIDRFCEDVRRATDDAFYSSLATFTETFLREDAALLAEMTA